MSFKKDELLRVIASKRDIIKTRTDDNISSTDDFKRLTSILVSFAEKHNVNAFAIHVKENDLKDLNFDAIQLSLDKILDQLKVNNFFLLDRAFNIESSSLYNPGNSVEARETFKQSSYNNHCVITVVKGICSVFVDGIEMTNATFLAEADFKKWIEKKDISQIFEVLEEYKLYIKNRTNYYKFFAEKPILVRLFGDNFYDFRNTLRNKPENILRNDLRNFLQERINRTLNFSREVLLDSTKRLDINTEDELGNYYFLEIKWVGKSLNSDATKADFGFENSRAQEGLLQTLEYIEEMTNANKTVKLGCLVIFDARIIKQPFTYDWDQIDVRLHKYKRFYSVVDDLHLENTHPS
ncbi:MAG: hypothetical protein EOO43_00825 [Flavobacterium sp.]|nr:MAG: hypothetical protein EOO43_00825 [Flavobacterium sp.]